MKIVIIFLLVVGVSLFPVIAPATGQQDGGVAEFELESDHDALEDSIFEKSHCMAEAIYFEAGNQPMVGKIAVAAVILNRVYSMDYPDSICEVVHEGPIRESWKKNGVYFPIKNKCQFSYYCDGRSDTPKYGPTWDDCLMVANWAVYDTDGVFGHVEGATHYHATYVNPSWASHLQKVVQIEDHVFYK